jgi:hypothetical protein
MLGSIRAKVLTPARLTSAVVGLIVAVSTMSHASAQSGYQRSGGSDRYVARHGGAADRGGRHAFGMAGGQGFADPNSPAATGGGSLGYNRKLLEY